VREFVILHLTEYSNSATKTYLWYFRTSFISMCDLHSYQWFVWYLNESLATYLEPNHKRTSISRPRCAHFAPSTDSIKQWEEGLQTSEDRTQLRAEYYCGRRISSSLSTVTITNHDIWHNIIHRINWFYRPLMNSVSYDLNARVYSCTAILSDSVWAVRLVILSSE